MALLWTLREQELQTPSSQREGSRHRPATCRGHGDCVPRTHSRDVMAESKGMDCSFSFLLALEFSGQITFLSLGMSQKGNRGLSGGPANILPSFCSQGADTP